jgi:hypothetical protein
LEAIRVSSKLSAQIRAEALQGKNPIFSMGSTAVNDQGDGVGIFLYSDPSELPKSFKTSVATPRAPAAIRSPVTVSRPG